MILHAAESFTVLLQRYYYKEENWAHSKVSFLQIDDWYGKKTPIISNCTMQNDMATTF